MNEPPRRLVLFPPLDERRLTLVRQAADPLEVVNAESIDEALVAIAAADGFVGKLTPELLAAAPRLSWVQSPTASLEHYVFPELVSRELTLTNMRGLFSDVIADHVLGMVLCFARNLHHYIRQQCERRWAPRGESARSSFSAGPGEVNAMDRAHRHLSDETLGVFGLGHIGREVARRAASFGMRVLALDPYAPEGSPEDEPPVPGERLATDALPQLLSQSHYVVIAAPHTPETEGLFTRDVLRNMRSDGILINIGRGAIVPLDDLVQALEAGELGGAALDVFQEEPLPPDHPLWTMDNVVITPHVAACSPRVAERHLETLLDNVRRFARQQPLRNVVRKELWF